MSITPTPILPAPGAGTGAGCAPACGGRGSTGERAGFAALVAQLLATGDGTDQNGAGDATLALGSEAAVSEPSTEPDVAAGGADPVGQEGSPAGSLASGAFPDIPGGDDVPDPHDPADVAQLAASGLVAPPAPVLTAMGVSPTGSAPDSTDSTGSTDGAVPGGVDVALPGGPTGLPIGIVAGSADVPAAGVPSAPGSVTPPTAAVSSATPAGTTTAATEASSATLAGIEALPTGPNSAPARPTTPAPADQATTLEPADIPGATTAAAPLAAPTTGQLSGPTTGQISSAAHHVASHVVDQVARITAAGDSAPPRSLVLHLDPGTLGEVRISLRLQGGEVRVQLSAEHAGVRETLNADLSRLHRVLGSDAQVMVTDTRHAQTGAGDPRDAGSSGQQRWQAAHDSGSQAGGSNPQFSDRQSGSGHSARTSNVTFATDGTQAAQRGDRPTPDPLPGARPADPLMPASRVDVSA